MTSEAALIDLALRTGGLESWTIRGCTYNPRLNADYPIPDIARGVKQMMVSQRVYVKDIERDPVWDQFMSNPHDPRFHDMKQLFHTFMASARSKASTCVLWFDRDLLCFRVIGYNGGLYHALMMKDADLRAWVVKDETLLQVRRHSWVPSALSDDQLVCACAVRAQIQVSTQRALHVKPTEQRIPKRSRAAAASAQDVAAIPSIPALAHEVKDEQHHDDIDAGSDGRTDCLVLSSAAVQCSRLLLCSVLVCCCAVYSPIADDSPIRDIFSRAALAPFLAPERLQEPVLAEYVNLIVKTLQFNKRELSVTPLEQHQLGDAVWQAAYERFYLSSRRTLMFLDQSTIQDGRHIISWFYVEPPKTAYSATSSRYLLHSLLQ